jgi:hypothetical protein
MAITINKTSSVTAQFADPQEIVINHIDDSIRIGDGTNLAEVTSSGALSVDISGGSVSLNGGSVSTFPPTVQNFFSEQLSVAAAATTTILSYTAPSTKYVFAATFSGTNVAAFTLKVNGVVWDRMRTNYSQFNGEFSLGGGVIELAPSGIITIEALHNGDTPGDFEAKVQLRSPA